jgi:glycosyltransferase involved in cell wall biosynthesis
VKPSIDFLSDYLKTNKIDALVSTGPPHSMHLIARALKKKFNLPWLADFRDPWTNIDFYADLMLTPPADALHHKLEYAVLKESDAVLSIGQTMSAELVAILVAGSGNKADANKFAVITNGFDEEDTSKGVLELDQKFSIAHIGTLVKSRNPEVLWKVLQQLLEEHPDFRQDLQIKLVGKVDVAVKDALRKYDLLPFVKQIEYLPHEEVIHQQQIAQVLLLLVNNTKNAKGILTGKFFEYLSARRPVLCIGPADAEVAGIIKETNCGITVGYEDVELLKKVVFQYYGRFKNKTLFAASSGIEKYARRSLTGELALLLDRVY